MNQKSNRFIRFIKGYFFFAGVSSTLFSIISIILVVWVIRQVSSVDKQFDFLKTKMTRDSEWVSGPVELRFQGTLSDTGGDSGMFFSWQAERAPSDLLSLKQTLKSFSEDKRVTALYLNIESLDATLPVILRAAKMIQEFKTSSQKPVYAWLSRINTSHYLLASVADQIFVPPAASIDIYGPVLQMLYFAKALEKIGIQPHVFKAGKFKSVFEGFERNEPSEEVLNMMQSLESSLRSTMVKHLASARNTGEDKVNAWLSQSIFTPSEAIEEGLIDGIQSSWTTTNSDQPAAEQNPNPQPSTTPDILPYEFYDRVASVSSLDTATTTEPSLGLLPIVGTIVDSSDDLQEGVVSPKMIQDSVAWLKKQDHIKGVLVLISSPGGSATASDIIWNDLRQLAAVKPVIAYMSDVAASGGYYAAVGAETIFAEPSTITGSIGVIGMLTDMEKLSKKIGVSSYVVTHSQREALLNPVKPPSELDRALMENSIEVTYQLFLERVAAGRKLSIDDVNELAQGRVYTGQQALDLGLIDSVGGWDEALKEIKKKSDLDPEKLYPLLRYPVGASFWERCLRSTKSLFECMRHLNGQARAINQIPETLALPQAMQNEIANLVGYTQFLRNHLGKSLLFMPPLKLLK